MNREETFDNTLSDEDKSLKNQGKKDEGKNFRHADVDPHSPASRQRLRDQVSDQVAQFLARGGKIDYIAPNVTADPPRKPSYQYGQRPI